MKNQTIKLNCGHEVEVIAIDVSRTYGDFLVGEPSIEDNFYVNDNLKTPVHWGERKTVMNVTSFDLDLKRYKPFKIFLWLSSKSSINDPEKKFDGSEVVVVWTIDDIFSFSINSLLKDGIKKFEWELYAVNFKI
jgi:hypothetical protein